MSIDKSDSRLTAYVFGELSAAEQAALEAELAKDAGARAHVAEIRRTIEALRSELAEAPPPGLEAEKRQRIVAATPAKVRKSRRRALWGISTVAAVAAVALLFTSVTQERAEQMAPVLAPALASAQTDAPSTLELAPSPVAAAPGAIRNGKGPPVGMRNAAGARPGSMGPGFGAYRGLTGDNVQPAPAGVKAGEWDDNANYREFMRWLNSAPDPRAHYVDVRDRRFIVVRDTAGLGVPGCRVMIVDESERQTALWTTASGRAILFPHAEGLTGSSLIAVAMCGGTVTQRFSLNDPDGVVELRLPRPRALPDKLSMDVAFILDSTGSMSEEIAAVKSTIQKVARALRGSKISIRVGLVEYKDRGDAFVTRVFPLSTNLASFSGQVADVRAEGGGDTPESVNEALHVGVNQLAWDDTAFAKLAFLVGDAPPHLDYPEYDYVLEAREAAHRGIQIYTVAASGMDTLGQVVWRQVAQYTGATNLFVLRGGAGPQSTGAGDPRSSCGGTQTSYTSGNLDALVLAKINGAIHALERDPLRIAGLGTDENAKPCSERIVLGQ